MFVITNAIDTAIENNEIMAIYMILNHITKYQDNYVSSYLFNHNLNTLIERGIKVDKLLCSDVFYYRF
jgi:hypothetical protein